MRIKNTYSLFLVTLSALALVACEDKINPKLETAEPVLVVDAWLTNKMEDQVIILTKTQPYFENQLPTGVSGATVMITDNNGKIYTFTEDNTQPGNYVWTPEPGKAFGNIGEHYDLIINVDNETFTSTSHMGRVPAIDSITFDSDNQRGSSDKIYQGEFWATDPIGPGDTYWIKAYKNGILLSKPSEINIAYDASFSAGGNTDGVTFITPKRRGINPNDKDSNNKAISPYEPGDSVNVQINSITLQAFNFLNEVITQTDRPGGFQELFSKPLENVSTNIVNTNPNGSKVLGFFNVAAVSTLGKKFKNP